ncbi:MAG: hypothetical protein JW739_05165 [Opitutales bacterium]|nr:hypothetical protein [Opitutales bacterium]
MATPQNLFTRLMGMSDDVWLRHTNPLSVWSRILLSLPILTLSIWSRAWIGFYAIVAIGLSLFWLWINPRLFPVPKNTNNWASQGVLGERLWINRKKVPVPREHVYAGTALMCISLLGFPFYIYGLYQLDFWPMLFGFTLIYMGKLWYFDRMVWLYREMRVKNSNSCN